MFYFRLAIALGKTVKQLLNEIDSRELTQWMAFYGLEPFGSGYIDDQFAQTRWTIAAAFGGTKEKPVKFKLLGSQRNKITDPEAMRKLFIIASKEEEQ